MKSERILPEPRSYSFGSYQLPRYDLDLCRLRIAADPEAGPKAVEGKLTAELTALARRIYETRRQRAKFFNDSLLGEPVWDMLLALYHLPNQGQEVSVSGLCCASGVPQTTGLRWLHAMEQKGLVVRRRDPKDRRRFWVRLSERGETLMSEYLSSVRRKLTPDKILAE